MIMWLILSLLFVLGMVLLKCLLLDVFSLTEESVLDVLDDGIQKSERTHTTISP